MVVNNKMFDFPLIFIKYKIKNLMRANSSRESNLNGKMQMVDLTGRVNFLDMKNNKIEKNMIECINFLKKSKFSEEKSSQYSTNKTSSSSKFNQQFRMTKRTYFKRQDIEKDQQANQGLIQNKLVLSSSRNKQRDNKVQKTLRGFAQRSIRTQPYPDSDVPTKPFAIQRTNPLLTICQNRQQSNQPKEKTLLRRFNTTNNNFLQQNKPNLSTLQKISLKQKQQRQKKRRQKQLKLVELKRKLLEEQERSIEEFENCVLYKQRIVDKLRSEERLKQILGGNAVFKVKRQN